jgi:tRNA (adenine37-N6)-methyltransferase
MNLDDIIFHPIGIIHSSFKSLEKMPIQPTSESSQPGIVEIFPEYADGIKDLEGFSHIYLIYFFHKSRSTKLQVVPFLAKEPHGVFATRAPSRPNPIGLSLVKISSIEGIIIHVERLDILDGTPLLDIKPYIPEFENIKDVQIGWLKQVKGQVKDRKSDNRFT